MRKLLLFTVAMLFAWAGFSQGSLYYEDFEGYAVEDFVALGNPTWWTTWSDLPGGNEDAQISDDYASSPTKSVLIDAVPGASDLILKLGDKTSGAYELDWDMYVQTNYAGYFNIQHFEDPGVEWAYEVYFDKNGTGRLFAGSSTAFTFSYPKDTWFSVENTINIDEDLVTLIIDGVIIHAWPFHYKATATNGTNQLGGVDFFAGAATGETPKYYFDNVDFSLLPTILYADDFESYNVGEFMAVVNPTWWTTWTNLPGSGEDGEIVNDYSNSPVKAVVLDEDPSASDLILKLGDKTSGSYALVWMAYVETGYAGYFNIQHFEDPGNEWAYEVYFDENGTGRLFAGSTTPFTFNYPKDTWFSVENFISIDEDLVIMTIDGVIVHSWPFHYQADATTGTNQLGGVDFWAGAAAGETPRSYFDDIVFIQMAVEQNPVITLDPTSIEATAIVGDIAENTLTITNDGDADLSYELLVFYPAPAQMKAASTIVSPNMTERSLSYAVPSKDPNARPASYNPVTDDFVLHYDGDNDNSFSWGPNIPYTIVNAAMFPPALTMPHAGMMITSVDIYFNELGEDFSLRIYDMGNGYKPGDLLVDQPFTPIAMTWNTVALDNPVYITGSEIWVGYVYTQPVADNFIPGVDAGPANINGDWISFGGVSWAHLTDYDSDVNWNIRANLSGTPIEQWLSVEPTSGVITPGNSDVITVTCDATNLPVGTYAGVVRVLSNDTENPQIDVQVTFEVTEGGTPFSVILDFEEQADWAMTFDPWTAVDVDGLETYGFSDTDFPNEYAPMAYIAFNPATTVPPMTDPDIQPHGGLRFGACMAAVPPVAGVTNNDWMISPQTTLGMNSSITLWVKAFTSDYVENYNVLVSTTDMDPGSFTVISGPVPMEAPNTWTEVTFDLSAYDGQTVYVAIQCVSNDAWVFMIDDVSIDFTVGVPDAPREVEFTIYPNPVTDQLNITSGTEMTQVEIFNQLGQVVYSQVVKDNNLNINSTGFNAGVYFVRITTDEGIATKKIMVK